MDQHGPLVPTPSRFRNDVADEWLQVLTRPINWAIIEQQYDELIKFGSALRLGAAAPL